MFINFILSKETWLFINNFLCLGIVILFVGIGLEIHYPIYVSIMHIPSIVKILQFISTMLFICIYGLMDILKVLLV